jgi:hypothetical protein
MKGYLFMVVMMGLGIALRMSGLAPDWFIASFYPGLGSALILGALGFTHNSFALIYRAANPGVRHHHFQHGSARRG